SKLFRSASSSVTRGSSSALYFRPLIVSATGALPGPSTGTSVSAARTNFGVTSGTDAAIPPIFRKSRRETPPEEGLRLQPHAPRPPRPPRARARPSPSLPPPPPGPHPTPPPPPLPPQTPAAGAPLQGPPPRRAAGRASPRPPLGHPRRPSHDHRGIFIPSGT